MMRAIAVGILAAVLGCATPAMALSPTWVQTAKNTCTTSSTCTATLSSAPTNGNLIVILCEATNATIFSLSGITYNGGGTTVNIVGAIQNVTYANGFGGYATAASSATTGQCTWGSTVSNLTTSITEVSNGAYFAKFQNNCITASCTASVAHSTLTSGDLAVAMYSQDSAASFGGCGTGWTVQQTYVCEGTDTSANTMAATSTATAPVFVEAIDVQYFTPPTPGNYPGGMVGDVIFELMAKLVG
jgi:hypothetical protein